jgi:serine/threonine protein kinase, bacterial
LAHAAPLDADLELLPGYRLQRRLGRGGFAEVWEARSGDGRVVALKFLPCAEGPATRQELRSIEAVRQLRHPNLIRVERVWCQPGYIVVAMERADASLLDLLDVYQADIGHPVTGEHACSLLAQAAAALDFLNRPRHRINGQTVAVRHRDVKPSNLLLFGDTVKLSDFGLAYLTNAPECACPRAGTVEYSAPEVFRGRVSDRTDQYALAVTYCHLRAGRLPFPHTPIDFDRRYVRPDPDLEMLPPRERPIVARALEPRPDARWPSCAAFIADLSHSVT